VPTGYTVTIHAAEASSNGSFTGHMWVTIDSPTASPLHYGFQIDSTVQRTDRSLDIPADTIHSKTLDITEAQFNAMKNWGDDAENNSTFGQYGLINNSCVDFAWGMLGAGGQNPTGFQGDLAPGDNWDNIDRLPGDPRDPVPPGYSGNPFDFSPGLPDSWRMPFRPIDPLALDLDGDGLELISVANSNAHFDFNLDGFAEKTGWLGADDGFLFMDANSDGVVSGLSELFGDATRDGYTELATLDSNADGKINGQDSTFSGLRIWRDVNGDGISTTNEISTLATFNIVSLGLERTPNGNMIAGNEVRYSGTYELASGLTRETGALYFAQDLALTVWTPPAGTQIPANVSILPNLHGYGIVTNLDYAMAGNSALLAKVDAFVDAIGTMNGTEATNSFYDILYDWAGVASVSPTARGTAVDGRRVAVLEKFFGTNITGTISASYGDVINARFEQMSSWLLVRFASQVAESLADQSTNPLFYMEHVLAPLARLHYDSSTDTFNGDFIAVCTEYAANLSENFNAARQEINLVVPLLKGAFFDLNETDTAAAEQALIAVFNANTTPEITAYVEMILGSDRWIFGTDSADTISTTLNAQGVQTTTGSDLIIAGQGDDALNGDNGNDTYIYNNGDGADSITELANKGREDKLQIAGHTLTELKVARSSTNANDLVLTFTNNTDKITLVGAAASAVVGTGVENFVLSGGVTKTLAEIYQIAVNQQQTTGADTVRGFNSAADVITGGLGNDALNGEDGNDTYIYNNGDGADTITELANKGTGDKLQIAGHTLAELKVARSTTNANDLVLTFSNNTDKITLVGAAASTVVGTGVESFVLSGGVTKTIAELYQIAVNQQQTTGADTISGFASTNDLITGGLGNDTLSGKGSNDTFVFAAGFGKDVISDFSAGTGLGDVMRLILGTSFDTHAEVMAAAVQVGANTVINISADDTITLTGITKTSLVVDDFAFV
jgi:hypothetical protein